ncbi:MAG: Trk system potassium transporter TrkA, partial [Nitrosomonas sp.]|nr:Trk system potassium transporter TrkA [Nitrosomonas sp.]
DEIKLPKGATIGAIVRDIPGDDALLDESGNLKHSITTLPSLPRVLIAHHDTVIEQNDHVIMFVVNKKMIRQVEKLFQVDVAFI